MNMAVCKHLPTEILRNIFQFLGRKDGIQCSMTCRAWNSAAQRVLFENLPPLTDQRMNKLATVLLSGGLYHSPGNLVKQINCRNLSDSFDLSLLDTLFPFLESIEIGQYQRQLYDKLYRLMVKGKFPNLNKMPLVIWDKAHFDLVLTRKEHIKTLHFAGFSFVEEMTEIFKNLHLFRRLKTIQLICSDKASIISLDNFLSNRPTSGELNRMQSLPSVREVIIENHHQFPDGMDFYSNFMKKFPNLEILQMISDGCSSLESIDYKMSVVECLSQFLLYLFNIKKRCNVYPIVTNQFTTDIVKTFLNQSSCQKKRPFHNPKVCLKVHCLLNAKNAHKYPPDLTAFIDTCRDDKKGFKLKVVYKSNPSDSTLPYYDLFEGVEITNVERLTIRNICPANIIPETIDASLDWTFLNCFTNLRKLTLQVVPELTFPEENSSSLKSISGSTLEILEFEHCIFNMKIFPRISSRCSSLKILSLDRCMFTKYNDEENREVLIRLSLINMPSTCLHELCISVCLETEADWYTSALIRLRTATKKPRYCKIVRDTSSPVDWNSCTEFDNSKDHTEDDFEMCLKDIDCKIFDIYCENVMKLTVRTFWMGDGIEVNEAQSYLEEDA